MEETPYDEDDSTVRQNEAVGKIACISSEFSSLEQVTNLSQFLSPIVVDAFESNNFGEQMITPPTTTLWDHDFNERLESPAALSGLISTSSVKSGDLDDLKYTLIVTSAAKENIKELHRIMHIIIKELCIADSKMATGQLDASCNEVVTQLTELELQMRSLVSNLDYSPSELEMIKLCARVGNIVDDVQLQPPLVFLCLVELGYYLDEFGKFLGEDFLQRSYVKIVHSIQIHLHALSSGQVVRQILFVPVNYDPIVSTCYKDRRLRRIEHFCRCKVRLLPPNDVRSVYCPPNFRTIEVNFHPTKGRYLGFADLLNRTLNPGRHSVRVAATVVHRSGYGEKKLPPSEQTMLCMQEPRPRYLDCMSNITSGHCTTRFTQKNLARLNAV